MTKLPKAVVAVAVAALTATSAFATIPAQTNCSYVFNTNMKLGMRNADVMNLQKVLNMDARTQVSASGVGSAGQETMYFGNATFAAVKKFQSLNGVAPVSGYAASLTRGVLNQVCTTTGSTSTTTTSNVSANGVSVAANSIPVGVLVNNQSIAKLADFVINANGTVTGLELMRTGISNNDTLKNVYLYDGATRLTDAASVLTDGTIRFVNSYGLFPVSGSKTLTVRADIGSVSGGQTVGVAMKSVTLMGATSSTPVTAVGPLFSIASADIFNTTLATTTSVASTIDAGRTNVVFWEGQVNTSKDSYVSGGLFSFTGSAPYSVFNNVKLYVDGVQVGNASAVDSNGRVTFSGSTFIRSGNHTISVRGDVTGGAGREFYVRLEDAGLSFEDASLRGVFGPVTKSVGFSMRTPATGSVQINSCSSNNCSIYSVDGAFSGTKVISGSSQQTIGKYTFRAVGESAKLVSGSLAVTGGTNTGDIRNVSVFVDGAQVVSGKTLALSGTQTALSNLGGAIVEMGKTVTIEIKADIASSTGAALTSNTLTTGLALEVQGQDSRNSTNYSLLSSNQVTVGTLNATFTNNSNFTGSKIAGTQSSVKVGSFTISTGNEAVRLTSLTTTLAATSSLNLASLTNFRLMDGSTQVWNQSTVGSGVNTTGTVPASVYLDIPANTTKTFDVFVDANNAANGGTLSVTGIASYQGVVSLSNVTSGATPAQVTTVATPALTKIARSATSLSDRYVVGGLLNNTAVFTLTATGTAFTATKMQVVVSNPVAVSAVSIAGVNAINRGSGVYSADVSKLIETIGSDVPVNVTFNTANRDTNTLSGATTTVNLSYVYGSTGASNVTVGTEDSTSIVATSALGTATSSTFTVVGAYPMVKMSANTSTVSPGTFNNANMGTVTITPVGGVVSVTTFGVNIPTGVTSTRIVDSTGNVVTNATISGGGAAGAQTVTISPVSNITSATTYILQGTGNNGGTVSTVLGASLGAVNTLTWNDVSGSTSATVITGSNLLPNYNN